MNNIKFILKDSVRNAL